MYHKLVTKLVTKVMTEVASRFHLSDEDASLSYILYTASACMLMGAGVTILGLGFETPPFMRTKALPPATVDLGMERALAGRETPYCRQSHDDEVPSSSS